MIATTPEQIKALRVGGQILAGVLKDLAVLCKEGVSTAELRRKPVKTQVTHVVDVWRSRPRSGSAGTTSVCCRA